MNERFIRKFSKKVNYAIPKRQLLDISDLIDSYLLENILNNTPIYIDKFGVITQALNKSHKRWSKWRKEYVMTTPTRRVVFRPHFVFQNLIDIKRKDLLKAKKNQ